MTASSVLAKLFALSALLFPLVCLDSLQAESKNEAERTIEFPSDGDYGRFFIIDKSFESWEGKARGKPLCYARGKVTIPAGERLMFLAFPKMINRPDLLAKIPSDALFCLTLEKLPVEDNYMTQVARLTSLERVEMDATDVSDTGLKKLKSLAHLKTIRASRCLFDGTGLYDVPKGLIYLAMRNNLLSPASYKALAQFSDLLYLDLARTGLKDEAFPHIAKLTKLHTLVLAYNPDITDKAIPFLKQLRGLGELDLRETSITAAGVVQLKGLKLIRLVPPAKRYSKAELEVLKREFPGNSLDVEHAQNKEQEVKQIFAPLH